MNELVPQPETALQKMQAAPKYTTILVPLEYMVPVEYNANELKDDSELIALKKSMIENREFLKARPILLNAAPGLEGRIIGGEKRYLAAKAMGWDKAEAMFVMAETKEKEKAWNLIDNHHNGEVSKEKLHEIITDLHEGGFDMDTLGFTPNEMTDMLDPNFSLDAVGDEATTTDEYAENGTTPGKQWLECPECGHQDHKKQFNRIDPPEAPTATA